MDMRLMDGSDADRIVNEKLSSRLWWTLLGDPTPIIHAVEERYYSGDAAADFVVFFGPPAGQFREAFPHVRLLPLVFAHKRRMTAKQLARLVREHGGPEVIAADLEKTDILCMIEEVE